MDCKAISIHLELRVGDDESLTGRATDCAGTARDFAGWLGLVATIDALVHDAPAAPAAPNSETTQRRLS